MSYTPTTWETGDTITAEKLNNMESGIEAAGGEAVFEIVETGGDGGTNPYTVNKTADEILAAISSGQQVVYSYAGSGAPTMGGVYRIPLSYVTRERINGEAPPMGDIVKSDIYFSGITVGGASDPQYAVVYATFASINLANMTVARGYKTIT